LGDWFASRDHFKQQQQQQQQQRRRRQQSEMIVEAMGKSCRSSCFKPQKNEIKQVLSISRLHFFFELQQGWEFDFDAQKLLSINDIQVPL